VGDIETSADGEDHDLPGPLAQARQLLREIDEPAERHREVGEVEHHAPRADEGAIGALDLETAVCVVVDHRVEAVVKLLLGGGQLLRGDVGQSHGDLLPRAPVKKLSAHSLSLPTVRRCLAQNKLSTHSFSGYPGPMPKVTAEYRDARRTHLLDAARRCFVRDGFHATSMADVCRE